MAENALISTVQRKLGFTKRYNALLMIWTSTPVFLWILSQTFKLHEPSNHAFMRRTGEYFYNFVSSIHRYSFTFHIYVCLPCGVLLLLQCIPAIRNRSPSLHRKLGYTAFAFLVPTILGGFVTMRYAFGGSFDIHVATLQFGICSGTAGILAWYNAKVRQLDQHRKWSIRCVVWTLMTFSARPILMMMAGFVTLRGTYHTLMRCDEIQMIIEDNQPGYTLTEEYPLCSSGEQLVPVLGYFSESRPERLAAALRMCFSGCLMVGLVMHMIAAEVYLRLTSAESERLRVRSYYIQKKRGYGNPGSAGTTNDRFGDAVWEFAKAAEAKSFSNDGEEALLGDKPIGRDGLKWRKAVELR